MALISLFRQARAVSQNLRRPDGERRVTNFAPCRSLARLVCQPFIAQFYYLVSDQIEQSASGEGNTNLT